MAEILMECGHTSNATCNGKPSCVICSCNAVASQKPDLTGRIAKCTMCSTRLPSNYGLAFFEYRGPGSIEATETCKCGYYKCAHERQPENVDPRSVIETGKCKGFEARGPREDGFYCGCHGWD